MCKRVFVLNKGSAIYDGDFTSLIKNKTFRKRPHDVVNFIQPKKEVYKTQVVL